MSTNYYAVIADAMASRDLPPPARRRLQAAVRHALPELNRRWRPHLAARFAVTLGDEIQGLLDHPGAIWEIVHGIRLMLPQVQWVVACGRGPLTTRLFPHATAPELDGPCFHEARTALERAKRDRQILAVSGFPDERLAALASYYSALYWSWTRRQREVATRWRWMASRREAPSRSPLGTRERRHPSALSHLRHRMAWPLVAAGDKMFRALLEA